MRQDSKIYVGLDTSKLKISVAVAEAGRDGDVRFIEIDSAPDAVERLITKLAKRHRDLAFCYEAGPTGYGLRSPSSDHTAWSRLHRDELWPKLGDDGLREAAYRGGCRACQNLKESDTP
ncbi:hypothetical protein NLM33_47120 (plasmid) [Bradyrhizobium sp. CCGUVB1N3]|uniref:hypothetical protein n=1 Tax=Bradyrhizobium sp. CCGUVB1N3 TaxID=2949629 RepID=UPI0020B36D88|nr:hypothetical protein [Bradyrhizobium sp. CCGUVB1N3]MCP3477707.1 hypothetical protein [Bradyrhizobium sp. CCGUVB1N3]